MNFALEQVYVGHFSIVHALLYVSVGAVLGLLISWVYRVCYTGTFVFGLIFLTAISTLVVIAVGESVARAFALAGALSIVRFRTPIKDVKDITFIFFALIIGLSVGTGKIVVASAAAILISALMIFYQRIYSRKSKIQRYLFTFVFTGSMDRVYNTMLSLQEQKILNDFELVNYVKNEESKLAEVIYTASLLSSGADELKALEDKVKSNEYVERFIINPLSDQVDY